MASIQYYDFVTYTASSHASVSRDLFGLTAFWNAPQKLTFIIWFSTIIPKMYFFPDFFFIKSYYDLNLFIYYVFVKKLELLFFPMFYM